MTQLPLTLLCAKDHRWCLLFFLPREKTFFCNILLIDKELKFQEIIARLRAWIPDVILFESKTFSLTFELRGLLGITRPAPSTKNFSALGTRLGIPSEPRSSKVRLTVLLSNRMTSGIHAEKLVYFSKFW